MLLRRRSLLLRILLFIPSLWFFSVLIFTYDGGLGGKEIDSKPNDEIAENRVGPQDQHDVQESTNKAEEEFGRVKVIQGFGPPMLLDKPSTEDTAAVTAPDKISEIIEKTNKGGLQISDFKKFIIDWNSSIYKNDPNMPGENGRPVVINKKDLNAMQQKEFDEGWTNNAFNQFASDMISVHRSLPVAADAECFNEKYNADLPDTTVIICFHNEAWSILLRTVHSVLDQTPQHLLQEIILVDDFSDKPHLQEPLDKYFSKIDKVKILRLASREGLIRARLKGFEIAQGKVVTFLDSHCECTKGWLEPLLARIKADPKIVVCPVIDVIDETTLEFHYGKAHHTQVGGFDWGLQFTWHSMPDRIKEERKRAIDPIPSPTMAGGLFAIDRAYFQHLGTYDPGFDIWGGENLELSFKIWMCGGRLEIVPCSHVGHVFRKRSPYKWRSGVNVLKRNTVRLAEVWLDEYKAYFYERINGQLGDYGNISDRVALRKNLNCSSFKWFLDNIYPEMFVPGESIASGELRNKALTGTGCVDSSTAEGEKEYLVKVYQCQEAGGNQLRNKGGGSKMCLDWGRLKGGRYQGPRVGLYWCHDLGGNQYWMLSPLGEIRRDESCLDYSGQDVMIYACHGKKGNQEWRYNHEKHQVYHVGTDKCLEMTPNGAALQVRPCEPENQFQRWVFKNYDDGKARKAGLAATSR